MRRHDWPERLARILRQAESRTFSETDYCVLFAADCVQAMTGTDYAADCRGLSIEEAKAKFNGSVYSHLVRMFGKPAPLALARRGDLIVRTKPELAMGICCGQKSAFLSISGGLAYVPTLAQRWAFRLN